MLSSNPRLSLVDIARPRLFCDIPSSMPHDDNPADPQDGPPYRRTEEIIQSELRQALTGLPLLGDDMFLRMQAFNLTIVDQFLMQLESEVLQKLVQEERTPVPEAALLSALSQMWVFAAYELMRTWRHPKMVTKRRPRSQA